jgi:pyruvate kinase
MRTKIVATIGPKSESPEMLEAFIKEGMDVARMNFSHCSFDEYKKRRDTILKIAKKLGKKVKLLQDLQGPRIRVGEMPKDGRKLVEGEKVVFSTSKKVAEGVIHVDDPYLHLDIKVGDPMYLANGDIEVSVKEKKGKDIITKVVRGGTLFSRKAVNVPHTKLTMSGPTEKDFKDLEYALSVGVDLVAVSFVQSKEDIEKIRKVTGTKVKIIAKIESAFALKNIDEIIRASDGIMIGRGDLGIEIPIEEVPYATKNLIQQSRWHGKPCITATQMLYSMVSSPRPTRAEVSDIANAVWDGSDAVMLSDETASGNYPLESLKMMARTVAKAESYLYGRENTL